MRSEGLRGIARRRSRIARSRLHVAARSSRWFPRCLACTACASPPTTHCRSRSICGRPVRGSTGYAGEGVIADRATYRPGDTARLALAADLPEPTILLAIEHDGTVDARVIDLVLDSRGPRGRDCTGVVAVGARRGRGHLGRPAPEVCGRRDDILGPRALVGRLTSLSSARCQPPGTNTAPPTETAQPAGRHA